jgi:hypothetical protein
LFQETEKKFGKSELSVEIANDSNDQIAQISDDIDGNSKKWAHDLVPIAPVSSYSSEFGDDVSEEVMEEDEDGLRTDTTSSGHNSGSSDFGKVFRVSDSESESSDEIFEVVATRKTREDEIRDNRQKRRMVVTVSES